MEYKRIGAAQPESDAVAVFTEPKNPMKSASEGRPGQKEGQARGAAVGGAVGHAVGGAKDAIVGAVSGGVAGAKSGVNKRSKDSFDTTAEHQYWRKEFRTRSYVSADTPYEQYGPAYQYGWECCLNQNGKKFQDVEPQLRADWDSHRGDSRLSWEEAKEAVQDAWRRTEKRCTTGAC